MRLEAKSVEARILGIDVLRLEQVTARQPRPRTGPLRDDRADHFGCTASKCLHAVRLDMSPMLPHCRQELGSRTVVKFGNAERRLASQRTLRADRLQRLQAEQPASPTNA